MSPHADAIRLRLSGGPLRARQLLENMGVSQPTISRALAELGDEVARIGAARSIQYALRDQVRGLPDLAVYRVDAEGRIHQLGTLIPVRPEGFVMRHADGVTLHSDGLPWWLLDLRPQGYLGRAYAARHGAELGLPPRLTDWTDTHALRALMVHGHDVVGNLLLGDIARDRFLATTTPDPIAEERKATAYARLALQAARGEAAGSSAGGEQPKFTTFAATPEGPRHVIVKFSEAEPSPISERWRDLLLAEHLALSTLREAGIPAARTRIVDADLDTDADADADADVDANVDRGVDHGMGRGSQRFLEVERFDRVGSLGRRALISLAALDAEFVGSGTGGWPILARRLAADGRIRTEAALGAEVLWAFGTLIGNTDMHNRNLSFVSEHGRPYDLAPAYDMTPMTFAPRSGGGLPDTIAEPTIHAGVANDTWRRAEKLARAFLTRVRTATGFSPRFAPCVAALERHIETASAKIGRLG